MPSVLPVSLPIVPYSSSNKSALTETALSIGVVAVHSEPANNVSS